VMAIGGRVRAQELAAARAWLASRPPWLGLERFVLVFHQKCVRPPLSWP
jgi:hypothetical protein